jgi:hypothetical protein
MTLSKYHGGTQHTRTLHRGSPKPEATTSGFHGGSGKAKGITHAPPPPGGAVNCGGTFGMGTLKKGKRK